MRKKEKMVSNGALSGLLFFVIIDGINQYTELKEGEKPFWENLDVERSFSAGVRGLVIGGTVGWILYKVQQWEEKDLPFCPDNHLHQVLNFHNAQRDPKFVAKAKELTNGLKQELVLEFGNDLVSKPLDFGSSKTRTAVGVVSDFDMLVPFKKKAGSMIDLYEDVYNFIEEKYWDRDFDVRKQRHSVGLTYDNGDQSIHIDIVPGRERNNFQETGDITIIRRAKRFWEMHKAVKTNIWKKREVVLNQPETRRIIKLMKIYRGAAELYIKSPVILSLVKEAMQKNNGYVNTSLYNNWTLAMGYIANQLQTRVNIKDVANSNNNLLEKMPFSERYAIANLIISDLKKLEKSTQYLGEIFELKGV